MDQMWTSLVAIGTAIVGVAMLSVLVSKNSNTSGVIDSAGGAFGRALATAVSPVTGSGPFSAANNFSNNSFSAHY